MLVSFDGWSNHYDYWAEIDTPDIHPIGYCDHNEFKLEAPRGLENFLWRAYLEKNSFVPAPFDLFTSLQKGNTSLIEYTSLLPSQSGDAGKTWQIGMKLEAKDRKNPTLIAVATISDIQYEGNNLLCVRWCVYYILTRVKLVSYPNLELFDTETDISGPRTSIGNKLGQPCGSCFCPPLYTKGYCAPGLICSYSRNDQDSAGTCIELGNDLY